MLALLCTLTLSQTTTFCVHAANQTLCGDTPPNCSFDFLDAISLDNFSSALNNTLDKDFEILIAGSSLDSPFPFSLQYLSSNPAPKFSIKSFSAEQQTDQAINVSYMKLLDTTAEQQPQDFELLLTNIVISSDGVEKLTLTPKSLQLTNINGQVFKSISCSDSFTSDSQSLFITQNFCAKTVQINPSLTEMPDIRFTNHRTADNTTTLNVTFSFINGEITQTSVLTITEAAAINGSTTAIMLPTGPAGTEAIRLSITFDPFEDDFTQTVKPASLPFSVTITASTHVIPQIYGSDHQIPLPNVVVQYPPIPMNKSLLEEAMETEIYLFSGEYGEEVPLTINIQKAASFSFNNEISFVSPQTISYPLTVSRQTFSFPFFKSTNDQNNKLSDYNGDHGDDHDHLHVEFCNLTVQEHGELTISKDLKVEVGTFSATDRTATLLDTYPVVLSTDGWATSAFEVNTSVTFDQVDKPTKITITSEITQDGYSKFPRPEVISNLLNGFDIVKYDKGCIVSDSANLSTLSPDISTPYLKYTLVYQNDLDDDDPTLFSTKISLKITQNPLTSPFYICICSHDYPCPTIPDVTFDFTINPENANEGNQTGEYIISLGFNTDYTGPLTIIYADSLPSLARLSVGPTNNVTFKSYRPENDQNPERKITMRVTCPFPRFLKIKEMDVVFAEDFIQSFDVEELVVVNSTLSSNIPPIVLSGMERSAVVMDMTSFMNFRISEIWQSIGKPVLCLKSVENSTLVFSNNSWTINSQVVSASPQNEGTEKRLSVRFGSSLTLAINPDPTIAADTLCDALTLVLPDSAVLTMDGSLGDQAAMAKMQQLEVKVENQGKLKVEANFPLYSAQSLKFLDFSEDDNVTIVTKQEDKEKDGKLEEPENQVYADHITFQLALDTTDSVVIPKGTFSGRSTAITALKSDGTPAQIVASDPSFMENSRVTFSNTAQISGNASLSVGSQVVALESLQFAPETNLNMFWRSTDLPSLGLGQFTPPLPKSLTLAFSPPQTAHAELLAEKVGKKLTKDDDDHDDDDDDDDDDDHDDDDDDGDDEDTNQLKDYKKYNMLWRGKEVALLTWTTTQARVLADENVCEELRKTVSFSSSVKAFNSGADLVFETKCQGNQMVVAMTKEITKETAHSIEYVPPINKPKKNTTLGNGAIIAIALGSLIIVVVVVVVLVHCWKKGKLACGKGGKQRMDGSGAAYKRAEDDMGIPL